MIPYISISERFSQIVHLYGNNFALTYRDTAYTYSELDRLTSLFAIRLSGRYEPGTRIGCAMTRSNLWVIALFGIIKARCVYVPLDKANPQERLQQIIDDCDIQIILHDADVDDFLASIHNQAAAAQVPADLATDFAYILYTSGTTGKPKGVPMRHFQVVLNAEVAIKRVFHTNPLEKVLQIASINFLVSLVETFTALLNGCHLVMVEDEVKNDPSLLQEFLNRNQVDRASIAPALLSAFHHVEMPFLKTIVLIGEPVAQRVRDYWMTSHQLVNCYGFTESALCIATGVYESDSPINDIGVLAPTLEGHLLDEDMKEVPDGTTGELYVGGPSLTEGYWNRPELNSTRFIENTYSNDENRCKVLYRTGDCMVRTPQGHLLYKGRSDDQVKIRGMRIETREVEIALDSCSNVQKSVVVAREIKGIKRLVAYLKPAGRVDLDQIRNQVSTKLPDFMCPSVYVILEEFPLTLNRKIDKRNLPEPVLDEFEVNNDFSFTENRLADIWASLLATRPSSQDDTFLSLGGDSLSVMYLAGQIEDQFGIHVSVSDLQKNSTLKAMSAMIDDAESHKVMQKQYAVDQESDKLQLPQSLKDLWLECHASDRANAAYQMLYEFRFPSDTDIPVLERAWNIFLEHQDAMRLVFLIDGNDISGKIQPHTFERLQVSDSHTPSAFFEQVRHQIVPESDKLYRVQLYRHDDGSYTLGMAIHHLITDGLSYQIISRDLSLIYKALKQNETVSAQRVSYREYLAWKRHLEATDTERKQAFWKNCLEHLTPLSILARKPFHEGSGFVRLPMSVESLGKLKSFCRSRQVTVTHVLLSVYGYVVGKFFNQPDFVIGVTSTDREEVRFLSTVGYMVSMLPLRTLSDTGRSFSSLVETMKGNLMEARMNAMPLSDLLKAANILDGGYFMRISYAVENERLDVISSQASMQDSPFPLVLYASQATGDMEFALQYSRAYFQDGQIESMAHCLVRVLDEMMANPESSLDRCSLATYTQPENTDSDCVPILMDKFYETVLAHPELTAFRYQGEDYSYGRLNEMSASFSSAFEEYAVNSQSKYIGVYLKNRKYLLPVILGLFRNGYCYVPIDTEIPVQRIRNMVQDAQLSVIITDTDLSGLKDSVTMLALKPEWFERRDMNITGQVPLRDDKAYVIFTSGSTGRPKGISISQANLAVYCSNFAGLTGMHEGVRVLQYASLGFDASVLEMFPALYSGATVVFPEAEQKSSLELLTAFLENEHISLTLIPPSLLSILPYRDLPDLHTLLVGGEATPKDVQERWRQGRTLINAYGPTENTVMATAMVMDGDTPYNNIGYPLRGVNCYVMDENRRLLPDYAIGELYIGGAQLTSGYLNNEEQNRLHFFEDPYRPGNTVFKSGDRVMRIADGSYLFLGRVDNQLKVRGFRIETSEIIHVLESIPDIRQAYVTVRNVNADAILVAYCIRQENSSISEQEVLERISNLLPNYMVPSTLMFIREFPLNESGKIDVSRLPADSQDSIMVPPSSHDEVIIESEICKLLMKEHVSVTSNLFSQGLTSILAMVLISNLEQHGLNYSYSDIYRYRTVRELARHGQSKASFWYSFSPSKPVVVLVCGYTSVSPFYDDYLKLLGQKYSVLVFDAFPVYYAAQHNKEVDARGYVDYMFETVVKEMGSRNVSVFAVTGHSLGSELGLILAEKLRKSGCPNIRALAIGTNIYKDKSFDAYLKKMDTMLSRIMSTMPSLHFEGDLRVALEMKPSNSVLLNGEPDPEFERLSETQVTQNNQLWKSTSPSAKILSVDTSHFGLLQNQYLPQLMSLLDN